MILIPDQFGIFAIHYDVPGRSGDVVNTCGFSWSDPLITPEDAIELIATEWQDCMTSSMSSAGAVLALTAVWNWEDEIHTGEVILGEIGDVSGDVMPPNVAVLVRKVTGLGGRRSKGRFYLPAIPKDDVNNAGLFEDTPRGVLQANLDNMLSNLDSGEVSLYVMHDDGGETPPGDPTLITSLVAQGKTATQRTRLRD